MKTLYFEQATALTVLVEEAKKLKYFAMIIKYFSALKKLQRWCEAMIPN